MPTAWILFALMLCRPFEVSEAVQPPVWRARRRFQSSNSSNCAVLRDEGSHFTAEVNVGTPSQRFDIVADTGSNAVIVSSCMCRKQHNCFPHSKCFTGGGASSTFTMLDVGGHGPPVTVLTFGSGQIKAAFVTDVVDVGEVETTMNNSLLLMIDHRLTIQGQFEGILGLGLPHPELPDRSQLPPSFLEMANLDRFSMCFGYHGDGSLRLNASLGSNPLGSVGNVHWGLDFRGISVGTASAPVFFCDAASMPVGQSTPCGAIPDSGTTLFMGPSRHIMRLLTALCEAWPRCAHEAAKQDEEKYEVVQRLLYNCAEWISADDALAELPPLHFHLVGAGGETEVLQIPGSAYILETNERGALQHLQRTARSFAFKYQQSKPSRDNVCMLAFGEIDFQIEHSGPVWILGTPVFYEYRVGYDLKATPPAMTFTHGACNSCKISDDEMILATTKYSNRPALRRLTVRPRLPSFAGRLHAAM